MTLRLYADRKGWALRSVRIELSHQRVHARDCVECEENDDVMVDLIRAYIVVAGDLDDCQIQRLLEIANRCPMHRTLRGGPQIVTELSLAAD